MKIAITMMALLATIYSFIACKKDNDAAKAQDKTIVGVWQGKWGDVNQAPQNFIKFEFKSNGELVRFNDQGQVIANGTWTVNGVQFECTYTHTADGQVHSIGGLYTDFESKIVGTWGYTPSKADGGTIEMQKQ
jgi:hypothetical protein